LKDRKYVKVCPKCGSTDITNRFFGYKSVYDNYVCNGCGYRNSVMPEFQKNAVIRIKDYIKRALI